MWFFVTLLISLGGLVLLFIPMPVPLFVPVGVSATGWVFARMLTMRTHTDRRLRRTCGVLALTTAGLVLAWYLVLGAATLFV
ncbi:MAG: hypothetical protein CVU59_07790 [Deltaproteobacteria bacterium HGW-Deltaproteobacteria-17]|nr:MAG: hypothetical protein CVU59_07790 [Deltaproteobacteria bacterium HGW-Deltaproteobacteria-17]